MISFSYVPYYLKGNYILNNMDYSTEEEDYLDIKYDDTFTDLFRNEPPYVEKPYNVWDNFFIHISDEYTLYEIFSHMNINSLLNLRKTNNELSKLIKKYICNIDDKDLIISIKNNYINYFNKRYENDNLNNIFISIKNNYLNKPIILPDNLINEQMVWYDKLTMMPIDNLCTFNVEKKHRVTENVKKQTFFLLKPDEIKPYLLDK